MNFYRYSIAIYFAVTAALVIGHIQSYPGDWHTTLIKWLLLSGIFCALTAIAAYVDKRWGG